MVARLKMNHREQDFLLVKNSHDCLRKTSFRVTKMHEVQMRKMGVQNRYPNERVHELALFLPCEDCVPPLVLRHVPYCR